MTPTEQAWLDVATHALYRAQNAAGVQALAADDLVLLHRYQAAHRVLADLVGPPASGDSGAAS